MNVQIIDLPRFLDKRGNLSCVEQLKHIPFKIKRSYWIYDVPDGESRGGHAHKALSQLIVAVSGSFTVTLNDGDVKRTFLLNRPDQGLYVMSGIWLTLDEFSLGAVCLVLASEEYSEDDYIRNYDEFLRFKGK